MKKIVGLLALACVIFAGSIFAQTGTKVKQNTKTQTKDENYGKVVYLTAEQFKKDVYDYTANPKEWVYNGKLPCVIDFYADWCRPCRIVGPIMDTLAAEFAGKLIVYKISVDKEKELAQVFGVSSIPLVLLSPVKGQPTAQAGALSKEQYIEMIKKICFGEVKK